LSNFVADTADATSYGVAGGRRDKLLNHLLAKSLIG